MNEIGVGSRVVNFLVDTILIVPLSYGLYKWYMFYVLYWNFTPYQFYVFFYLTLFAYYFLWESITGRTPGKLVTLSRVRTANGKRAGVHRVFLRSILRLTLVDPFFIPLLNRPLHDALSGTRVVEIA